MVVICNTPQLTNLTTVQCIYGSCLILILTISLLDAVFGSTFYSRLLAFILASNCSQEAIWSEKIII